MTDMPELPIPADLFEILRCPHCAPDDKGLLDYVRGAWFVCRDCGRKYPILDGIPYMMIPEGERWQATAVADLPVPPPEPAD